MEMYFIITNSDGDTTVECVTKEVLLGRINANDYGANFLDKMPKNSDTNYWDDGVLIIKGNIALPFVKKSVIEFNID